MRLICAILLAFAITINAENSMFDDFLTNISDLMEIKQIGKTEEPRSDSLDINTENYLKNHEAIFNLMGSTVALSARNLDNGQVDLKITSSNLEEGRKSKLKKIIVPIFIFILIKAIVLIPLALGILAIKTWNALQLSFASFVVALSLGVWSLCKKVAGDHPHIIAHSPWEYQHRSLDNTEEAQKMAYSSHL